MENTNFFDLLVGNTITYADDLKSNNSIFRLEINGLLQTFLNTNNHQKIFFCSNYFSQLKDRNR